MFVCMYKEYYGLGRTPTEAYDKCAKEAFNMEEAFVPFTTCSFIVGEPCEVQVTAVPVAKAAKKTKEQV